MRLWEWHKKLEDGFLGKEESISKDAQEERHMRKSGKHQSQQRSQAEKMWEPHTEARCARLWSDLNEDSTGWCWVHRWKPP